mmetsp:Transcript_17442/g.26869  ORF Transcript_17442/g.26869 Transcript_17442/m.26869 type:complete len:87 (-) Transcript_17442:1269-1529(-)
MVISVGFGSYLFVKVGFGLKCLEFLILLCPVILGSKLEHALKCIAITFGLWFFMIAAGQVLIRSVISFIGKFAGFDLVPPMDELFL